MAQRLGHRAVVLGASIAGLLAARVLADCYDEVEVIDRDELPEDPGPRGGVPQARHAHALLAGGVLALEELLPGLIDDLVSRGAPDCDPLRDCQVFLLGNEICSPPSGLRVVAPTRPFLELRVRTHVRAVSNIKICDRTDVTSLMFDGDMVTGVLALPRSAHGRQAGEPQQVVADLVVDATGRGSKLGRWLADAGWPQPTLERIPIDLAYTSRRYRFGSDVLDGRSAVIYSAYPGQNRGAVAAVQEDGIGLVSLNGMLGDHPPTDPDGFHEFAHSLPVPLLHRVVETAEPVDPKPVRYRFPDNVRRRYDRLDRFPRRLLVFGDAVTSTNPVNAQGMSVTAINALVLRDHLRRGEVPDGRRLAHAMIRRTGAAWDLSAGSNRAFDGVPGQLSPLGRIMARYVNRLQRAAVDEPAVATALIRVVQLLAPPPLLLRPDIMLRGLRPRTRRRDVADT
jgi:2-polyprenyl-6-methoxyphenol hydroxylase-like FAD-dependent oxidoreductase